MKPVAPVRNTLIRGEETIPVRAPERRRAHRAPVSEPAAYLPVGRPTLGSMENAAGLRNPRARQRALAIGIAPRPGEDGEPLAELKELLRTAGVATAGEMVQVRPEPDP